MAGIIRKIDELGRVTIPIEIRRLTGIDASVCTDLYIKNGAIRLSKGNGRALDKPGRYTIPKEIRLRYGWETGQEMEVYAESECICIKKKGCDWCEEAENLIEVNGHHICKKCALAVADALLKE